MTDQSCTDPGDARAELVAVIQVVDAIDPALTGHVGAAYRSPPQTPDEALTLVGLLLRSPPESVNGRKLWTCAIAGGRRTITLELAPSAADERRLQP